MVDKLPKESISANNTETNIIPLNINLRKTKTIHTKDIKFGRISSLNRTSSSKMLKISKQFVIKRKTTVQHYIHQRSFNKLNVGRERGRMLRFMGRSLLKGYSILSQRKAEGIKEEVTRSSVYNSSLDILINKTRIQVQSNILKKLQSTCISYQAKIIEDLMVGKKSHLKCERKECSIYDDASEYLKRYYTYTETVTRFSLLYQLYKKYCNMKPSYCVLDQQSILMHNVHSKRLLMREKLKEKVSKGRSCKNILTPEFLKELDKGEELNNSKDNELRNKLTGDAVYKFNNYNDYTIADKCKYEYLKHNLHEHTKSFPKHECLLNAEISEIKINTPVDNSNECSVSSKLLLPELPSSKSIKKSRLISMCSPKCLVNYKSNQPSTRFHMRNSSGSIECTNERKDVEPYINYANPPLAAPVIKIECCRTPSDKNSDCDDIEMLCVKYGQHRRVHTHSLKNLYSQQTHHNLEDQLKSAEENSLRPNAIQQPLKDQKHHKSL
jgi:hypothetical protein